MGRGGGPPPKSVRLASHRCLVGIDNTVDTHLFLLFTTGRELIPEPFDSNGTDSENENFFFTTHKRQGPLGTLSFKYFVVGASPGMS